VNKLLPEVYLILALQRPQNQHLLIQRTKEYLNLIYKKPHFVGAFSFSYAAHYAA
jgi:hypothetical protein